MDLYYCFYSDYKALNFLPVVAAFIGILLFIRYCYNAYKQRIRKQVDEQVKLSLLSVVMLMLPVLLLVIVLIFNGNIRWKINLILTYGFLIFFGWITAIILGMTFKTLPFIVWNKVYHHRSGLGKTPNPKDLFNNTIFKMMSVVYIAGLIIFVIGILISNILLLKAGAIFLLLTAILYNWNVLNVMTHKPKMLWQ